MKAAAVSTEKAAEMMKLTKGQIEVTTLSIRAGTFQELSEVKLQGSNT